MDGLIIAIDGPAGAGKTATSRALATELGLVHFNSGNSYRGITYALISKCLIDEEINSEYIEKIVTNLNLETNGTSIYMDGIDITAHLATPAVNTHVSRVAKYGYVRNKTNNMLKKFVKSVGSAVVEGRDIGSVVLPNADLKIFLTASIDSRAKRRMAQIQESTYAEICSSISKRDDDDMKREISPLVCAKDAYIIDNSDLTMKETVSKIVELAISCKLKAV